MATSVGLNAGLFPAVSNVQLFIDNNFNVIEGAA